MWGLMGRGLGRGAVAAACSQPLVQPRCLHASPIACHKEQDTPRVKIGYIPNPFKWLHNHMELATLRQNWDPTFHTGDFKYGALQAVCTVSDLLDRREWGELCGLLTQKTINKLRGTTWTFDQLNNLTLQPQNIQIAQIKNVNLHSIVDRKYCDIDFLVIGTKIPYNPDKHSLILLEYHVRFHREYTEGRLPEWTITRFKLEDFRAVSRADQ